MDLGLGRKKEKRIEKEVKRTRESNIKKKEREKKGRKMSLTKKVSDDFKAKKFFLQK